MSWSIAVIGKPENVVKALEEESGKLSGQSKVEYDDALPALVSLVKQNFATDQAKARGYVESVIKLTASGSGMEVGGAQLQRSCAVQIEAHYTRIV